MYYRSAENYLKMTGVPNMMPDMTYETQDDVLAYKSYLRKHYDKNNRGAGGTRDSEMQKCYDAEHAFEYKLRRLEKNYNDYITIDEARAMIRKIVKSKTYFSMVNNPKKVITAETKNYRRYGGKTNGSTIWFKPDSIRPYTVLHELAHCMGHMHHGRSFRQCVVKLVSRFMGTEPAKLLKESFRAKKLSFGDARKPQTFDKWLESRNRMKKIRAKSPVGVS